jgi:iron-sulfur cluster repair protein YtfE (RIC family)
MSKAPPRKSDAVTLLDDEHIAVKKLFQEFNKLAEAEAPADERKAIADKICMELSIHAQIEEEIFYPPVREATGDDDMMDEADVEHAGAKNLIAQIVSMEADESHFNAKVKVLGEMIDHHVGEERDEMFPQARATGIDLVSLKQQLAARRAELEQEHNATA